jgi:hypothetical protein
MGFMVNSYRVLADKMKGNFILDELKDDIKMDIREM